MAGLGTTAEGERAVYLRDFRFEPASWRLWRLGDEVTLRPKAAAVLALLVARAGEVVPKQDLLDAVWPRGFVGEVALSVCISELRRIFDDDIHQPRFISTAHRRGYRLVADVSSAPQESAEAPRVFVGRTEALATLGRWWEQACGGQRRIGFVRAPAGVGKSALLDAFAGRVRAEAGTLLGRGQCVEQARVGEPYLPALQALAGLWRGPGGLAAAAVLRRCAASWLVQLPGLFGDAELAALRVRVGRASEPRLLREFAVAVEQLSMLRPVLLVFEDLHDADRATVELISYLARRREPARLLLLGSYRSAELISRRHPLHPLVQELTARGLCADLALELLSPDEVGAYLAARLAPRVPSARLAEQVHERTEGNALFVAAVTEHLDGNDLLAEHGGVTDARDRLAALGVPGEVRLMLERQVDTLDENDRRLLETAAAAGVQFAADSVSAGLARMPVTEVEERCDRLARLGALLRPADSVEWPDGTVSARYRFTHEMYRDVLYQRLGPARRVQAHRAIGARIATAFGTRASEVASELAGHFERGRDYPAAAAQFGVAATVALNRSAYPDAHSLARRGLELLDRVDDPARRDELELTLRRSEVVAAVATWGWGEPRAQQVCLRLRELAARRQDTLALLAALLGLHNAAMMDADTDAMRTWAAQVDAVAEGTDDAAAGLIADLLHIRADSRDGNYPRMRERSARMLASYRTPEHADLAVVVGDELDVAAHLYGGLAVWHLGFPDQAREHAAAALDEARNQAIPAGLSRALWFAAVIHLVCGEAVRVRELAAELASICAQHGLRLWGAGAEILDGWAVGMLDEPRAGLARMRRGVSAWGSLAGIGDSFHQRLIAELCLAAGDVTDGLAGVRTGLAAVAGAGYRQGEPELLRLHGELLLVGGRLEEAEQLVSRALESARRMQTRSFELRAATSLAGLWHAQGRAPQARDLLASVYAAFAEGHDTADLLRARALLDRLS